MIFPRELHRFYKNPLKLLLKESNYLCIITFTDRLVRTHPFSYNPLCRYWFDQQIVLSIRFQIYNPASQAMNDIVTNFNTTLVIYIENNINMWRQLITHNFITGTADKKTLNRLKNGRHYWWILVKSPQGQYSWLSDEQPFRFCLSVV